MTAFTEWTAADAVAHVAVPTESDDKYSRGVLGVATGSDRYPGAAVLGVEAALRTGLGMVRYLGAPRVADFVLARRPEVVVGPGRVQAWLIGSGTVADDNERTDVRVALTEALPTVLDAGALGLHTDSAGPTVLTPHAGELAHLLGVPREDIAADPPHWALEAAEQTGATVLLKGHSTYIAGPGVALVTRTAPTWLAAAGAGDVLGGILGALLATHSTEIAADERMLARLAATASVIHGLAATRASNGGPLTALDVATEVSSTIAALLGSSDRGGVAG